MFTDTHQCDKMQFNWQMIAMNVCLKSKFRDINWYVEFGVFHYFFSKLESDTLENLHV